MVKVVGIDPVTGAPVVEEVDSSFVIPTNEVPSSTPITTAPKDAIKPVTEAKPLVGIDNSIDEARRFNEKLSNKGVIQPLTTAVEQKVNKDVELMSILKRYGMDSQQQGKAFAEIKSLFG
jgi:hypothetical protein